jgi:hypothetical protein
LKRLTKSSNQKVPEDASNRGHKDIGLSRNKILNAYDNTELKLEALELAFFRLL